MLVQSLESTKLSVTEVALIVEAVPRRTCCDILCARTGAGKHLVCYQATAIPLTDGLKHRTMVEISSSRT
jgi:hypothetical protein